MRTKKDIWLTYLGLKGSHDRERLSLFLSDPKIKRVIDKKDFDVYQTKRSNIYHIRNCSYLRRSRNLKVMKRSNAIISGDRACSRCIKEFNSTACLRVSESKANFAPAAWYRSGSDAAFPSDNALRYASTAPA